MSLILNQNEENTKKVNSSINQENALFGEECNQQEVLNLIFELKLCVGKMISRQMSH
ncbi:unnamed protein product [Meloidogyne enterolobii]|uniref:Uncharacterized protein n=1 Tax=Meloidogyne enterolobii TaxID=390850 RepID=A0ACB0ZVV4_MELEN